MWLLPHKGKRSTLIAQAVTLNKDPLHGSKGQAALIATTPRRHGAPVTPQHVTPPATRRNGVGPTSSQKPFAPAASPRPAFLPRLSPSVCLSVSWASAAPLSGPAGGRGGRAREDAWAPRQHFLPRSLQSVLPSHPQHPAHDGGQTQGAQRSRRGRAVDAATAVAPVPGALCAAPPPVPPTVSSQGTSNPSRRSLLSSRSACPAGYFFLELQVF